jgi:hypothetical protein
MEKEAIGKLICLATLGKPKRDLSLFSGLIRRESARRYGTYAMLETSNNHVIPGDLLQICTDDHI